MVIPHRISLPYGWRLGTVIQEGDLSLTAWLLYGTGDMTHSGEIEELLFARSMPELAALALRKIATATGASSI